MKERSSVSLFSTVTSSWKDKNENVIGTEEDFMGRWTEYFTALNVEVGEQDERLIYVSVEPEGTKPSLEEVEEAEKRLRNGRAPGEDQLVTELLKYKI